MTAQGHIIFAIAITIFAKRAILAVLLVNADWWHLLPAALLTCLLPDIDHKNSVIGQRIRWLSIPIARVCGHRGFTHSLLCIVLLWLCLYWLYSFPKWLMPLDVIQGMIIGYLSHIMADMLTSAGVPLFWPCRWRCSLPLLKTKTNYQIELERILCFLLISYAFCAPTNINLFFIKPLFNYFHNSINHLINI
ncbi:metal-dependent hydrolase [Candidatus Ishikawella capsulata]|uniref:Predicted inner membrane protein regulated by LexA n=1 Tax=Candidatus Ishikawaella capsulata Mpkobe TaxID=476281 RepID=C5WC92_9ENTR|nr:metal-dependent hydrolase [Candidatus Ishikawaella capsulata]BAH82948.1 predicted inner membrane protein regulated by LexA [Candidatus Ishikawaella capsulata Mpkobe]